MKIIIMGFFLFSSNFSFADSDRISIKVGDKAEQIVSSLKKLPLKRVKFAISGDTLEVSSTGKKQPKHNNLALNGEVVTGGYLKLTFMEETIKEIEVDNYSGRLCPSYSSLISIFKFIEPVLGVNTKVTFRNNPNLEKCSI